MNDNCSHLEGMVLTKKLNRTFNSFFISALSVANSVKGYGFSFVKHIYHQITASKRREIYEREGTHVPPFLIYSVTQKCNLKCKGCYSKQLHSQSQPELVLEKTHALFREADKLGISVIMLAGGEPLTKEGLLESASKYSNIIFPLFTNGLLLNEAIAKEIKSSRNIFPIISVEGGEYNTDERRGRGTYDGILKAFKLLRDNKVLFGASITVTSSGKVEPCPFSPYSDVSFAEKSLKEALKSKFLKAIRENHDKLSEHHGGCALWENREWVKKECSVK